MGHNAYQIYLMMETEYIYRCIIMLSIKDHEIEKVNTMQSFFFGSSSEHLSLSQKIAF